MFRNEFKNALIAASLTLLSVPVVFASTPTAPVDQRRAEYRAHQETLSQIQANRPSIIQAIVQSWSNEPSVIENVAHWVSEMTNALNKASNEQIFQIQNAQSYSEVLGVLQGDQRALPSGQKLLSGFTAVNAIAPASLGDAAADLVFTPVFPCRIFDTRPSQGGSGSYGDGSITANANNTRNYLVYGTGAEIGPQGGNTAGCPAPNGEPSAISANFTVVPIAPAGHITVYPYDGILPTASVVNFYAGTNIANAAIVQTAYLKAYDLTVFHYNQANSLADVMGYFYPATADAAMASGPTITDPVNPGALFVKTGPSDITLHSFGPSARITITSPSQKVFWTAHHAVGTLTKGTIPGAGNLNIYACYKDALATAWEGVGDGSFNITMLGIQKNIVSESAVVEPGLAGEYDFGLCYITDDPNWNYNESGYVAAQRN
jgi:hypothetical protein